MGGQYLGEVFDRPLPEPLPRWDVEAERLADMWATEHESRSDVVGRYRRAWEYSDATVDALALDATGRVTWWQDAEEPLFNILAHLLAETSRHASHTDILREELDGAVGTDAESMAVKDHDPAFWTERARGDRGGRQVSRFDRGLAMATSPWPRPAIQLRQWAKAPGRSALGQRREASLCAPRRSRSSAHPVCLTTTLQPSPS